MHILAPHLQTTLCEIPSPYSGSYPPTFLIPPSFYSSHWTSHAPTSRPFHWPETLFPQIQSLSSYRNSLKEKPSLITQSKQQPSSCYHCLPWLFYFHYGIAHHLTQCRFVYFLSPRSFQNGTSMKAGMLVLCSIPRV